jgi:hypothetical protein
MAKKLYLKSMTKRFKFYKDLGDKTFEQLHEDDFDFLSAEECNSIAMIIQHLYGNMLSRWTDFLTTDGEKEWRQRDAEFEKSGLSKEQLIDLWEKGWNCVFETLSDLRTKDLKKTITIRDEKLSVVDAINRQLAHYAYHVGQIIYAAKIIRNKEWKNLSVPKNQSAAFNDAMKNP